MTTAEMMHFLIHVALPAENYTSIVTGRSTNPLKVDKQLRAERGIDRAGIA